MLLSDKESNSRLQAYRKACYTCKAKESANASVLLSRLSIELMQYKKIQNVFQITKNVGTIYKPCRSYLLR